jgi:2-iminobutanoate/2-iminopropanoate deaminase
MLAELERFTLRLLREIAPSEAFMWRLTTQLDARRKLLHLCCRAMSIAERKNHPHLAQPLGPYVEAAKHNGLLFLSGITALGSSAQGRSIAEQVVAIRKVLASIARSERTDLSSLLKVTLFVTSLQFATELSDAWSKNFGGCTAMSSLVQIGRLVSPDVLVEVEAVLALPDSDQPEV